jgi:hypothetical protein
MVMVSKAAGTIAVKCNLRLYSSPRIWLGTTRLNVKACTTELHSSPGM